MFQNGTMLFIAIIGAISNRVRGGWLTDIIETRFPLLIPKLKKIGLWDKKKDGFNGAKDLNAIIFGLLFGALTKIWLAPLYYGFMRLSFAFGWGGYIGAIIDRRIHHDRDDVLLLDKWFRGDSVPVLSGWAALSCRGFMLTAILSLPFYIWFLLGGSHNVVYLPLVGLAMGTIYLVCCEVCQRITIRGHGWQWGEIIFGGYLWAAIYLLVM